MNQRRVTAHVHDEGDSIRVGDSVAHLSTHDMKSVGRPGYFTEAAFECEVMKVEFMQTGNIRLILVVPHDHRDEAIKLGDAYGKSLAVAVELASAFD